MEMANTLVMPAGFAVVAQEELTYIDGGAESGLWANWNLSNFIHGFTLALGSSTLTACTNFILTRIPAIGLGGAFAAAGTAFTGLAAGQYVMFSICAAAAAYTIWYEFTLVYNTLESLYYKIFPKKEEQEEETAVVDPVTNGFHMLAA